MKYAPINWSKEADKFAAGSTAKAVAGIIFLCVGARLLIDAGEHAKAATVCNMIHSKMLIVNEHVK